MSCATLAPPATLSRPEKSRLDAHVVILNNYLRPHHVAVYRELARRVRKLTVLLGTPMEPDRNWAPEWADLDVRIQKNWTWKARWRHSTGFDVPNFVHFPVDTVSQLRRLKPEVVCSAEFGVRSLLAGFYRFSHRRSRLIVIGNMSAHIERERGAGRRMLRAVVRRFADRFTWNGSSCRAYLGELGIPARKTGFFPYYFDEAKVWEGEKRFNADGRRTLSFSGFLDSRKGVPQLARALREWSRTRPGFPLELLVCGTGPLSADFERIASADLTVRMLGHADDATLRQVYADSDLCVFPSLADEWGLVPVEAMRSGVPVLGSVYAQSVEDLVVDGVNGWRFRPDHPDEFLAQLDRALGAPTVQLAGMSAAARASVSHITADWAAEALIEVISDCLAGRPNLP